MKKKKVVEVAYKSRVEDMYCGRYEGNCFKVIMVKTKQAQFTLNCLNRSITTTCKKDHIATFEQDLEYSSSASVCPDHFKWIHEDLKPWKSTGITRETFEFGKNMSDFRLIIIKGKAYIEKYRAPFQTRDVFTLWGISQLLRLYPGKIPDLELLFEAGDRTQLMKEFFEGAEAMSPPPIFHYCGNNKSFDIVFPDWTFWGWGEVGIRSWEAILQKIKEGNSKLKWKDRMPYAFWKGNTLVSFNRGQLRKCNTSDQQDWNAHIFSVHWDKETAQGFQNTKLEDQCTHRYKIYVEGVAWSVSEKYIIACDSMTLFIEPEFYDFFTRSLVPFQHYWPISNQNMCEDIKDAVNWGNAHPDMAEAIGKAGTKFIEENVKMKFVYDYMFHLLNEYASLLRFKPIIPAAAVEICSETLACPMDGLWREYMVESMVKSPSVTPPCIMPPPTYNEDKGDEQ
ncbi:hypothetical protein RIF29_10874 [Crotalaria pallida]|uniref:Glycosyl transferase CAP10 domain-containing protein n=1 Tax=Crotalaria pallida TaxID=3830 RepID=A0AAN9FWG4_CROPI